MADDTTVRAGEQDGAASTAPTRSGLVLPAAALMVLIAPRSPKFVDSGGALTTPLVGYGFCLLGFLTMLLLWEDGSHYHEDDAATRAGGPSLADTARVGSAG